MPTVQSVLAACCPPGPLTGWALFAAAGLALSGPTLAQSAASSIDQPTPGTLPDRTSASKSGGAAPKHATGHVAAPSAIQSSTDVMQSEGSIPSRTQGGTTDPIKHLPKDMR